MKVIIWGAGKGFNYAYAVSKALKWTIEAVVDSNVLKTDSLVQGFTVQQPDILKKIDKSTFVVVASSNDEIFSLARKYTDSIIDWQTIKALYKGAAKDPKFETCELAERNLHNGRLLPSRSILLERLANDFENDFSFAEVGVAYGDFSQEILKKCNPSKLYLIDMWEDLRYKSGLEMIENIFRKEIKEGKIEIRRGYSIDVLEQFEDNSIDMVYIDTDHSYDTTWKELMVCSRKVNVKGYICGHDYTKYNSYSRMDYGVYDAVNRFCVEYGYEIAYLTMEKDGLHSYALRKIYEA